MMDRRSFERRLNSVLQPHRGRWLILTIGNPLHLDDGVGPALASSLAGTHCRVPILNTELSPERYVTVVERLKPSLVLVADAVDLGLAPGTVSLLTEEELVETQFSTHDIPLRRVMAEIRERSGAQVLLIGIQPRTVALGEGLSSAVEAAVGRVSRALLEADTGSEPANGRPLGTVLVLGPGQA